jgi:hypothetical protein
MKNFTLVLVLALLSAITYDIVSNRYFNHKDIIVKSDTITIGGDTSFYPVYKTIYSRPDTVFIPDVDTLFLQDIDTMSIIIDYFTKKHYVDTLSGQEVDVIISESIFKNKLENRDVLIKNNRQSKIITNTLEIKPQDKLFIGGGIVTSKDMLSYQMGLKWLTKKDMLFGIDYNPIEKQISASAYFKIKRHK